MRSLVPWSEQLFLREKMDKVRCSLFFFFFFPLLNSTSFFKFYFSRMGILSPSEKREQSNM